MSFIFEELNESDAIKYGLDERVKYWAIERKKFLYMVEGWQKYLDKRSWMNLIL